MKKLSNDGSGAWMVVLPETEAVKDKMKWVWHEGFSW